MSKFRYFVLSGEALKLYLESEKLEFEQKQRQFDALLKDRDDIESFRPGSNGGVVAIRFKKGRKPTEDKVMVSAGKRFSSYEVRPHKKSKEAAEWRELLDSIRVTENSTNKAVAYVGAPTMVFGGGGFFNSRVGHVGPEVILECRSDEGLIDREKRNYQGHEDLTEIDQLEYERRIAANKDYEYKTPLYTMTSRLK